MNQSVYKEVLLDHFRHPRNKGDLDQMHVVRRGSNPMCGDEIEIGLLHNLNILDAVRFRGRGCSVCLASASMMSENAEGLSISEAKLLSEEFRLWMSGERDDPPSPAFAALDAVRGHSARKKCVMIAWQAMAEALESITEPD